MRKIGYIYELALSADEVHKFILHFYSFSLFYIPNNIRLNFSLKPSFATFIFVLIYYLCGCTVVE